MKASVKKTNFRLAFMLLLMTPMFVSCGKARYQQVTGVRDTTFADAAPGAESMGTMTVRPAPAPGDTSASSGSRPTVPPRNASGEEVVITVMGPGEGLTLPDSEAPAGVWMDPSHSNPAADVRSQNVSANTPSEPILPARPEPCLPKSECFIGEFTQPTGAVTDKLDLVFVVDTSESIFKERAAAADGIDRFMAAMPPGTDYRIGVIVAHGESTGLAGELVRVGTEPAVLESAQMSRGELRAALRAKLVGVRQDAEADGGELGMYSLNRAITGDKLEKNRALGMFRRDAGLAVIFLSDENDICSLDKYPNAKKDPNGKEVPAYKKYCFGQVGAASLYRNIVQLKVDGYDAQMEGETISKPLLMAAIVYTDPKTVPESDQGDKWSMENEVGYGYLDVVRMNNGVAVDLAGGDIPGALAKIGAAARGKLALKTEFLIHETRAIDTDTLRVFVDGKEVAHSFDSARKQVNLAHGGGAGSKVEIHYCLDPLGGAGLVSDGGPYQSVEEIIARAEEREAARAKAKDRLVNAATCAADR